MLSVRAHLTWWLLKWLQWEKKVYSVPKMTFQLLLMKKKGIDTQEGYLDGVQVSGFSSFQKSVVHIWVPHGDVFCRATNIEELWDANLDANFLLQTPVRMATVKGNFPSEDLGFWLLLTHPDFICEPAACSTRKDYLIILLVIIMLVLVERAAPQKENT